MDGFGRDLELRFNCRRLLDVLGEEKATGKSLGTTWRQKPTLPDYSCAGASHRR